MIVTQVHSSKPQCQADMENYPEWTYTHPMITDPPPTDSTIVPQPREETLILNHFNNLNQTSTAKEIWDNVEMLMQGSGRTVQQRKEDLFNEYERFCAIGNESIHDYFEHGYSTTPYVQIYTHLKAYEPHAKKTLKKQEQSTSIVDPLAYVAHTTTAPVLPSPSTSSPQPTAQSSNDALMATMTQIANLLSGFQKQFPPTNNQLRTSSNSRTHATGSVKNLRERWTLIFQRYNRYLMEAKKRKECWLDAEAEAVSLIWECTAPYEQPQALTTTNTYPLHPITTPCSIWYSEEKVELSVDQAYWLSANEIASQASKPATPATPFVHKSRPPSQVLASLRKINAVFSSIEDLRSAYDREHTKVLELEAEIYKTETAKF
ncbi:hypothetical protein Tco_0905627 [Tanacetum coccineum]